MYTSKIEQVLTSIVICHYHLVNCKFMQLVDLQISCVCISYLQAIKEENVYTQGQLKLTRIHFVILNGYVTVIYLRFIKKHLFLGGKKQMKQQNR